MAKEVKLFGCWASPFVVRVEIALDLKGIEYEYIEEDLRNKSELLLKYNAVHKKVPVLVHGGKPIAESMVIIEYIDETWPENPILPQDPYDRAMARFWAKFADEKCVASSFRYFSTQGEEQEKAKAEFIENLKILEGALKGNKFFGGDAVGFIDIVAGFLPFGIRRMEEFFDDKLVDEDNLPHLNAWFHDFLSHPSVSEKLPPADKFYELLITHRNNLVAPST